MNEISCNVSNIEVHCVVREKNPYPPHGKSLEIPRGRGVLRAKLLEEMYENKLEFPGGRKPSMQGVWICSGTARYTIG